MSNEPERVSEHEAIAEAIQPYIDGAKSGSGDAMRPSFHKDATIFGYAGSELFGGPIEQLFSWADESDPSPDLHARIASIEVADTVATMRLELSNLGGHRYTDLFTLLEVDGDWKIMNKVFHLHTTGTS